MFGPQPRSYRFKLNKQVKDLARRSALTYKARNNEIIVVEDFTFEAPSTKRFIEVCKNLQVENKKTLFLLADANKVVYLSSRNLQRKRVLPALQLNTYTVVDSQVLVLTEGALSELDGMFHKF